MSFTDLFRRIPKPVDQSWSRGIPMDYQQRSMNTLKGTVPFGVGGDGYDDTLSEWPDLGDSFLGMISKLGRWKYEQDKKRGIGRGGHLFSLRGRGFQPGIGGNVGGPSTKPAGKAGGGPSIANPYDINSRTEKKITAPGLDPKTGLPGGKRREDRSGGGGGSSGTSKTSFTPSDMKYEDTEGGKRQARIDAGTAAARTEVDADQAEANRRGIPVGQLWAEQQAGKGAVPENRFTGAINDAVAQATERARATPGGIDPRVAANMALSQSTGAAMTNATGQTQDVSGTGGVNAAAVGAAPPTDAKGAQGGPQAKMEGALPGTTSPAVGNISGIPVIGEKTGEVAVDPDAQYTMDQWSQILGADINNPFTVSKTKKKESEGVEEE